MATMSFRLPEDMIQTMEKLGTNYDKVVGVVLQEGVTPLYEEAKSQLSSVIGKDTKQESHATGDLLQSLVMTKPFQTQDGNWNVKVGCAGVDHKGVSNAMKAAVLEYGKSDQVARPWLKSTVAKSKKACIAKMQQVLTQEVEKL